MDNRQILKQKSSYTFDDLVEIMRILRGDDGCPWDKEQTHKSIRNSFIEETYEFIEGVDNDDYTLMCEELGDCMLQIVFHAQMANENSKFNINDVIDGICKKMILRHPHIFADTVVNSSSQVLENWDEIKKVEKNQKTVSEKMQHISKALPSLIRAQKLGKCAAKVGFDFKDPLEALEKIVEETSELKDEIALQNKEKIKEEMGDLLFAAVNTSRLLDVDAEQALYDANDKFLQRFTKVEKFAQSKGQTLNLLTVSEMNEIWDIIKK